MMNPQHFNRILPVQRRLCIIAVLLLFQHGASKLARSVANVLFLRWIQSFFQTLVFFSQTVTKERVQYATIFGGYPPEPFYC